MKLFSQKNSLVVVWHGPRYVCVRHWIFEKIFKGEQQIDSKVNLIICSHLFTFTKEKLNQKFVPCYCEDSCFYSLKASPF